MTEFSYLDGVSL